MTYQVSVSQLAPTTTKENVVDFFSFCGKISSVDFNEATHIAHITFEKEQAAKTALMLNGGTLDGAHVVVTSDTVTDEHEARPPTAEGHDATIEQHDKPKAGIVAEILAKGYVLSEQILHKAIEIDQKQGISTRFINYIRGLDSTVGAQIGGPDTTVSSKAKEVIAEGQARAHTIDEQHGISRQATDYYTRAIQSDFGQKVVAFYTQAAKQAQDVHEEAKRIAQLSKEKAPGGAAPESSTGSQA